MKPSISVADGWGASWLALSLALALHVWDEAVHDFLGIYNPTVLSIRDRLPFLPLPTFTYELWLLGLIAAVSVLLLLSVFAFRGSHWLRPIAYGLAAIMLLNGVLHLSASVYLGQLMPGAYTSPALIAASVWLLVQVRSLNSRTGHVEGL